MILSYNKAKSDETLHIHEAVGAVISCGIELPAPQLEPCRRNS